LFLILQKLVGKSTTVSVLTGLTPPTSGDVTVHGHSLRGDLAAVRGPRVGLGVCPQTNVVFEALTVEEHLAFFAKVKKARSRWKKNK
jgi:ABC-type multidrug transport system ATPase subunit